MIVYILLPFVSLSLPLHIQSITPRPIAQRFEIPRSMFEQFFSTRDASPSNTLHPTPDIPKISPTPFTIPATASATPAISPIPIVSSTPTVLPTESAPTNQPTSIPPTVTPTPIVLMDEPTPTQIVLTASSGAVLLEAQGDVLSPRRLLEPPLQYLIQQIENGSFYFDKRLSFATMILLTFISACSILVGMILRYPAFIIRIIHYLHDLTSSFTVPLLQKGTKWS